MVTYKHVVTLSYLSVEVQSKAPRGCLELEVAPKLVCTVFFPSGDVFMYKLGIMKD